VPEKSGGTLPVKLFHNANVVFHEGTSRTQAEMDEIEYIRKQLAQRAVGPVQVTWKVIPGQLTDLNVKVTIERVRATNKP
jgi:hypothetical protein